MGHTTCCVFNCQNTGKNCYLKFYIFPRAAHKLVQREKWISAVRKVNGASWVPKPADTLCSAHFLNNKKAEEELSPSYVPTIFSTSDKSKIIDHVNAVDRTKRYVQRVMHKRSLQKNKFILEKPGKRLINETPSAYTIKIKSTNTEKSVCDQACDANFLIDCKESSETLICNRYVYKNLSSMKCDVQIQTELVVASGRIKFSNRYKRVISVGCNTELTYEDKSVGTNADNL